MYPFISYPHTPMSESEFERSRLISEAVDRTRRDIGAMPLDKALKLEEAEIMRMAIRHTLAIQKENDAQRV